MEWLHQNDLVWQRIFLADQKLNIQRKIEYSNGMKIHEYTFSQPVSQPDLESGSIFTKV